MLKARRGPHALGHRRLPAPFRSAVTLAWGPVLAALAGFSACEPTLVVGTWQGSGEGGLGGQDEDGLAGQGGAEAGGQGGVGTAGEGSCDAGAAGAPATTDPLAVPWSSGFENGFCEFQRRGTCFADPGATFELVDSPVRSGNSAAAFTIDTATGSYQSRCLIQGELPEAAYYGAWYYLPAHSTNNSIWNLFHFQGGEPSAQHGLWDVSLRNGSNGNLEAYVYDFLRGTNYYGADPPAVPIGAWFHLEFYLRRAADQTGEVALYQDGQLVVELTGLLTDDTNWAQWYVGHIANYLSPSQATVYVDDITIGTSR